MTIQLIGNTRRKILRHLVASYDDVARTGEPCLNVLGLRGGQR